MASSILSFVMYWLTEHPSIVNFRWNPSHCWFSTWSFLFSTIAAHLFLSLTLNLLLWKFHRPIPLGPIPAIHSLSLSLLSAFIFSGLLFSAFAEIRDTRWFWRRSKTPFQWLLCFPLGTKPSGRIFFWSHLYFLSLFLHLLRTPILILRRKPLTFSHLLHRTMPIFMCFLWLEFSQSLQVISILSNTFVYVLVYGFLFWRSFGLGESWLGVVVNLQMVISGCNLAAHLGVLVLHLGKEGCNGIGAWGFNSVMNGALLFLFLNFYLKKHLKWGRRGPIGELKKEC
ncbi:elongation of fatty acids protein 3-like [Amborella trichopoda]|uniref:Elongation of fatty acids protein 3-like n=1 Tax=Amborella trichopoda TaxID=13333 RepID=U5DB29_AMBTC|nr:elongation of fatty acids protein 3-like [Amborella trichopoda]ERN17593.1 hypothetical protein AMTR_s00059p00152210 [Amborella trichopoda]|eukprot:XP_006856126.1 elongation of fatty acids protein 3-like [Amborella trichopoda]